MMIWIWFIVAAWVLCWLAWFIEFTDKRYESEVLFNLVFGFFVWPLLLLVKTIVRYSRW